MGEIIYDDELFFVSSDFYNYVDNGGDNYQFSIFELDGYLVDFGIDEFVVLLNGDGFVVSQDVLFFGVNSIIVDGSSFVVSDDGFDMVENDDDNFLIVLFDDQNMGVVLVLGGCLMGNLVDDCWKCNFNWVNECQKLVMCVVGFGRGVMGGRNGRIYVVIFVSDDNFVNFVFGMLWYVVIWLELLWIIFVYSMIIRLKNELMIMSFKMIDGCGVIICIFGGVGLILQCVNSVIIYGIVIYDI